MKYLLLLLLPLMVASCSTTKYAASVSPDGTKNESLAYNTFGGSSVIETAGGTRVAQNHNKTGGQFFQTVAAVAGSVSAAYVKNSDNVAATAAGQQSVAKEANARVPTIVPAQAVKPDTTVFPLVVPPPKPIVP